MNDLQKIEFEMLKYFVEICENLDLQYYLVCGSALGAIKYGGFIPWDDDIDVALPRDDYEIFVREAQKYLPENIFVQNYRTDKNYPLLGTKLRDSNTTYIEEGHSNIDMNHGVFIDVFPLDGFSPQFLTKEEITREKARYIRRKAVKLTYNRFSGENLLGIRTNLMYLANRIFGAYSETGAYIARCESVISKCPTGACDIWINHADYIPGKEYEPRWYYGKGTWATFETLRVRVPERYDEYLTQRYGNWRADLPVEERKGHHYYHKMDLNKSYVEYMMK